MPYRDLTLYYRTGTGNSYRVATWLAEAAEARGLAVHVVSIDGAQPGAELQPGPEHLLALTLPTHGFTAPWSMIRFVLGLPRRPGMHAVVLPSRAGSKMGKRLLPGMEGTAGYLLAAILVLKGYDVRGVRGIDMPSNWTAVHPGFGPEAVTAISERGRAQALAFIGLILAGERRMQGRICLALGLLLLPVSLGYFFVGRFLLAKLFFAGERCNGCGQCAEACPKHAIRMWRGRPYWTYSCESCMRCMGYCPQKAVEVAQPYAVGVVYLAALPVVALLIDRLVHLVPPAAVLRTPWVLGLLGYPYKLLAFFVAYLVLTLLLRVPPVNRALTAITLTHYWRRYHAPVRLPKDRRRCE
jgi:Pyruvate/2-oxoacid:ferredoxin oxidoreductase delta subunit